MKQTLLTLLLALLPLLAAADAVEIGGIYYNMIRKVKTAEVTSKPSGNYSGEIVIPESVEHDGVTYSVTGIGDNAFRGCSVLTSVTIPNSVTSIGSSAFYGCSGLTSVTIGNSVTSIGSSAFALCSGLTSVTIPNSVTTIGDFAFAECSGLTSVTIGNSVTTIGDYAFHGCSGLTSVTIPNSVTDIGGYAFSGCSSLTSVIIPNSVESIGRSAFKGCNNLNRVNVPVTDLVSFCNNKVLGLIQSIITTTVYLIDDEGKEITKLNIPEGVTSIGYSAFSGCSGLTSVTIGNSVTSIGDFAFRGCNGLMSVTIPNSVTSIGSSVFRECNGLMSVTIGNSVTSIGSFAFALCNGLTSVTIPNSVTRISSSAFSGCSSLSSVTIGSGVEQINESAFSNCAELTDVYCLAENVPSTNPSVFDGSYIEYATLHVPASSINSYKEKSPWSSFGTIVAIDGDVPEIEIPEPPVTPKCATPTIAYKDGRLTFGCETEGVEYVYEVTMSSSGTTAEGEVELKPTFRVTVYAQKEGFVNSDLATADITVSCKAGDTDGDGTVDAADLAKLIELLLKR